ncbi:MAG: ABC transporter ATP-binding protein [Anaerolineales bacterium]|nr:ABC transporter ATP-binding protein [Anaerolineales bacterium]
MTDTVNPSQEVLLEVENLKTYFFTREGVVKAVDGVDFNVKVGEIFGLVGESGCGKSVTSLSILRLIDRPGRVVEGKIKFLGRNLPDLTDKEMKQMRGNRISMIFQQPLPSLDPVYKVGDQLVEALQVHSKIDKKSAWNLAVEYLDLVGIPDPKRRAECYPFELSGGMAQRVMIAMALTCEPGLLIADEPTTALDVTIQAQILELISNLRDKLGMAVILITHDLGVVAETADRVAVMYAGRIMEEATVDELFSQPLHPYTSGLLASIPVLDQEQKRLNIIPGVVPDCINLPAGCKFAARCQARVEHGLSICHEREPHLVPMSATHKVRCWLYEQADSSSPVGFSGS